MKLNGYEIVYLFGNLFNAYVIYKYMYIFYHSCKVRTWVEHSFYIGYFGIVTVIHTWLKLPIIVLGTNLILIVLLTFLYEKNIKKILLSSLIICFSLTIIETIVVVVTSSLQLNVLIPFHYDSEIGVVFSGIISLAFVMCVKGFKYVKNSFILPGSYWISLLVIPLGTIFLLFIVYMDEKLSRQILLLCLCSAFLINVLSFYLYDKISGLMQEQIKRIVMERQAYFYEYQVQMMQDSLDSMRKLRHDMKNKMSSIYILVENGKNEEVKKQLSELTDVWSRGREYACSGNFMIDSLVNYKLQKAEENKIDVSLDIIIPAEISMPIVDMAVILGNLLDNALEAVERVEKRWLNIKMKFIKGCLIIEISNSYDGIILQTEKGIVSRKDDRQNHGLGIDNVKDVLEKYNGLLRLDCDGETFKAKALVYL